VWDAGTGDTLVVFHGHEDPVSSAAFSPDGTRIVTASADGTARIWDAETGADLAVMRGLPNPLYSAAFAPDGARLVTASSNDLTVRVWDVETAEEVVALRGHERFAYSAVFSPDGTRILTGSGDSTARIWETTPYAQRYAERREYDRVLELMEPVVDRLFDRLGEPRRVAESLRGDRTLTDLQRQAAITLVLKRCRSLREQQEAE
jgi:dipeptidyl aminopeptidase/acylaminoacyl peptidase